MASGQGQNLQMEPFASTDDTISEVGEEFLDLEEEFLDLEEVLERPDQASDLQKANSDFKDEVVGLETDKPVRSSMLGLPVEVWVMILGFLPDKNHVRAAVHSCRYLRSLWYVSAPSRVSRLCLLLRPSAGC